MTLWIDTLLLLHALNYPLCYYYPLNWFWDSDIDHVFFNNEFNDYLGGCLTNRVQFSIFGKMVPNNEYVFVPVSPSTSGKGPQISRNTFSNLLLDVTVIIAPSLFPLFTFTMWHILHFFSVCLTFSFIPFMYTCSSNAFITFSGPKCPVELMIDRQLSIIDNRLHRFGDV